MNRVLSERLYALESAYRQEISYFVKIKAKFYNISIPTITIYENGKVDREYNFPTEIEDGLSKLDDHIKYITEKYKKKAEEALALYRRYEA